MNEIPEVSTLEEITRREGYQSLEPTVRPPYWGIDLDRSRRPGVPMERPPQLMPNARVDIEPQQGTPSVRMHGRPNKKMPPVFSTAVPLKGASGLIRRFAAVFPDHKPHHWLLKLLSDRVDALEHMIRRSLPIIVPAAGAYFLVRRVRA